MTRINTISPKLLLDQHLMAEYRETPMVPASLKRTLASKRGLVHSRIPANYTLNAGHVTFFYDKGKFLHERYQSLVDELLVRGYDVKPEERIVDWDIFQRNDLYSDWTIDAEAIRINLDRVMHRVSQKDRWYRFYRTTIEYPQYVQMIRESGLLDDTV
jgi:deoxyribonuclease (pyrimidine dimer)